MKACRIGARAFLPLALLSGCTVIQVDGDVRTSVVKFGVLRLEPAENVEAVVYRTQGIGIVPGHNGVTVGASDETVMLTFAPDSCRVILFQPKREDLDALLQAVAAASVKPNMICIRGTKP